MAPQVYSIANPHPRITNKLARTPFKNSQRDGSGKLGMIVGSIRDHLKQLVSIAPVTVILMESARPSRLLMQHVPDPP